MESFIRRILVRVAFPVRKGRHHIRTVRQVLRHAAVCHRKLVEAGTGKLQGRVEDRITRQCSSVEPRELLDDPRTSPRGFLIGECPDRRLSDSIIVSQRCHSDTTALGRGKHVCGRTQGWEECVDPSQHLWVRGLQTVRIPRAEKDLRSTVGLIGDIGRSARRIRDLGKETQARVVPVWVHVGTVDFFIQGTTVYAHRTDRSVGRVVVPVVVPPEIQRVGQDAGQRMGGIRII